MQQWTLESGILFFLSMLISSCRYASYWSLMNFMMGCQLNGISGDDDEERAKERDGYSTIGKTEVANVDKEKAGGTIRFGLSRKEKYD